MPAYILLHDRPKEKDKIVLNYIKKKAIKILNQQTRI